MDPTRLRRILDEIMGERDRQEAKYGDTDHPDYDLDCGLTQGARYPSIGLADEAKRIKYTQFDSGSGTWPDILISEVAEVVEAAQEVQESYNQGYPVMLYPKHLSHLREELLQVAAAAVAWIEAIDGRTKE